jgi:hypothetical protein
MPPQLKNDEDQKDKVGFALDEVEDEPETQPVEQSQYYYDGCC